MNWWLKGWQKYAVFGGRSRRKEYWYFLLFTVLANIACMFLDTYFQTRHPTARFGLIGGLFSLAALTPTLAVSTRRLHDSGRSGWYLLLGLIPVVGAIVLLVFMAQPTVPGSNAYGPDPHADA